MAVACGCGREFVSLKARGVHRYRTSCRLTPEEQVASDREASRRWRIANLAFRNEIQRVYRQTPTGREVFDRYQRRVRQTDRGKARIALTNAIARGHVTRQPCEVCGIEPSQGHHAYGYEPENWLNVRWLCSVHHREAHRVAA